MNATFQLMKPKDEFTEIFHRQEKASVFCKVVQNPTFNRREAYQKGL
jgi:hypothetical protein